MKRHLDENEIAAYVDALEAGTQDTLSERILDHVEECIECKMEIVDVYNLRISDAFAVRRKGRAR